MGSSKYLLDLWFPFQAGKYVWQTYKEVYDLVIKLGNSIRSCGIEEVKSYRHLLDNYLKPLLSCIIIKWMLYLYLTVALSFL